MEAREDLMQTIRAIGSELARATLKGVIPGAVSVLKG